VGALVSATAIWGSTFVVTKASLAMRPASFLSWRFGLAAVVLVLARPSRTWLLTSSDRRRALLLGALLGAGFLLQTTGLQTTSAGVSGFLRSACLRWVWLCSATTVSPQCRAGRG
jgi:drug/metabolite transporter (DMT)-like permease